MKQLHRWFVRHCHTHMGKLNYTCGHIVRTLSFVFVSVFWWTAHVQTSRRQPGSQTASDLITEINSTSSRRTHQNNIACKAKLQTTPYHLSVFACHGIVMLYSNKNVPDMYFSRKPDLPEVTKVVYLIWSCRNSLSNNERNSFTYPSICSKIQHIH